MLKQKLNMDTWEILNIPEVLKKLVDLSTPTIPVKKIINFGNCKPLT
jgi:hypothetical protein